MTKTKGTLASPNVFVDKNEMLSMPVAVVTGAAVASLVPLKHLRELDLSDQQASPEGAKWAGLIPSLRVLRISGAKPVEVPMRFANGRWTLDLDRLFDAVTPRRIRELTIMRVAQMTDSHYEWAQHLPSDLQSWVLC